MTKTTVRKALSTAIELAEGKNFDSRDCGLRSYDNWIKGMADAKDGKPGFGAAYSAACWADSRSLVVSFLTEAKRRLDDEALAPQFDEAIKQYGIVSACLSEVAGLFPLGFDDEEQMAERFRDHSRRQRAKIALEKAKSAEVAGLAALESILRGM